MSKNTGAGAPFIVESPVAEIEINAEHKKAQINVGGYKILIEEEKILIGKGSNREAEPEDPLIEIKEDSIVLRAGSCGLGIKKDDFIGMGVVGSSGSLSSGVKFSKSGEAIKVTGSSVSLL
jgi:hypothetical protein